MISMIQVEGQPAISPLMANVPTARVNSVTPGYFSALHIPLIEGRLLDERDGVDAPKSVIVNQAFVRHFFEKEDPIGKRFTAKFSPGPDDPPNWTIVGVINDTKQRGLAAEVTPEVTAATSQWPRFMMTLVLRTSLDPANLVSAVRQQVSALDKNIPVYAVQTMATCFPQKSPRSDSTPAPLRDSRDSQYSWQQWESMGWWPTRSASALAKWVYASLWARGGEMFFA